jgi:S1-C subfamily serine protease
VALPVSCGGFFWRDPRLSPLCQAGRGCSTEVGEQCNPKVELVQLYHFRRETTRYFLISFTFALLLLSNLRLLAYSIPEIVAKTKPAVVEIAAIDEKGSITRLGTGFFISPDGQAVTNWHVVEGSTSIAAVDNNGAIFPLERVVAQPAGVDLVILKFRGSTLITPLPTTIAESPITLMATSTRRSAITTTPFGWTQTLPSLTTIADQSIVIKATSTRRSAIITRQA